jgi:hypothetical protein
LQRAGTQRWAVQRNNATETGSNAGCDFLVTRNSDAQAALFLDDASSLLKLALDFEPDAASETMQNNAAVLVHLVYQATGE